VPPAPPQARAVFGPALGQAERYAELLAGPAVEQGLIGPRETARLWDRHLLNCAAVAELIPPACSVIDLGSGAGLPGVVIAMLRPQAQVVLLEPMARRVAFLQECVQVLGLGHASVCRGRAEDLAGQVAADVVTARAVAPMERLAGLALGLARPGGLVLAMKGAGAAEELARAGPALARLGARDVAVVHPGRGKVSPPPTVIRLSAPAATPGTPETPGGSGT
jgi:16S rRNA (guanine527-N7)-methyltransferase